MANVLQLPVDFHLRPLTHAPSPLGFGFGLGSSTPSTMIASGSWPLQSAPTVGHTNPAAFHQLASSMNLSSSIRAQKRRHEAEDEGESEDRSMDRSPPPERPKRAAPKRARMAPAVEPSMKGGPHPKGTEAQVNAEEQHQDVDVGMLLASLPRESLLPLLSALLNVHPSLKPTILSLIPRPTLETALQALAQSSKKLREAYPYSNVPSFSSSQSVSSTAFGFGKPSFTQTHSNSGNNNGMRDSYIISRLKPHISEFTSACLSYLPYFSSVPDPSLERTATSQQSASFQKEKAHPADTFLFLSAVTNHVISQPPLTQSSLGPMLLARLSEEWKGWVHRIDEVVNHQGGMFGSETVQSWIRALDEMAGSKMVEGGNMMQGVRDLWVAKVGWMVGRTAQHEMTG